MRYFITTIFLVICIFVCSDNGFAQEDAIVYYIQPGDTLSEIASKYNLTVAVLSSLNDIDDPDKIRVGDKLVISYRPQVHEVKNGECLSHIAAKYGVTIKAIATFNHLKDPNLIRIGQKLIIPPVGGEDIMPVFATSNSLSNMRFLWPLDGGVITSLFGPRGNRLHKGLDIAAPKGTPVLAAADGKVTYADWAGTYGILVVIEHGNGVITRYAHNSSVTVKVGDLVQAGNQIATIGSTGKSTGPHLHFEVEINKKAIDPLLVLSSKEY